MATAIQLELVVDEKGAVQGVRAFDSAIQHTRGNVKKLDSELSLVPSAAARAGSGAKRAAGETKEHFEDAFNTVRLLRMELGIQLPRAMESIISRSQTMMSIIGKFSGLMIGIGAGVAIYGVAQQVYGLYERFLDVNASAREYNKEIQKSKEEDFGNARSIETVRDRIEEATVNLRMYQQLSDRFSSQQTGWGTRIASSLVPGASMVISERDLVNAYSSKTNADKATQARRQLDNLRQNVAPSIHHQAILDAIELSYADEEMLRGEQKITAEKNKQHAINEENRKYVAATEGKLNIADPDAGRTEEKLKNQIADRRAAAQVFALHRDQAHELLRIYDEANNARLHGSALYEAQEDQAIKELEFEGIRADKARAAVEAKFAAEKMARLQDELYATEEIQAKAGAAGMTGIARIQAEGDIQIGDIRGDKNLSDKAKDARVAAAKLSTHEQILQAQRQFAEQVDSLADQSADHQLQGFARIRAAEAKQLDDLKKKFDEVYGHMDMSYDGAAAALARGNADYEREKSSIEKSSADQTAELSRRNAEETADIETQARIRFLSAEKQQTAAIEAEYQQRQDKLQEQLDQGAIQWGDYNRRLIAAGRERDAELVEAATAAREKMAGQFNMIFRNMDHPLRALQEMGAKAASEAAAAMVERIESRDKRGAAPAEIGGIFGGVFGGLFGHHGHPSPDMKAELRGRESSASSSAFAVSTALIQVGSAQIAFGGGMGTTRSSSGFFSPASFSLPSGFPSSSFSGGGFGGAGGGGFPEAAAHTSGGAMPSGGGGMASVLGNLQQGVGLSESMMGIFKRSASSTNGLQPTDLDIPNGTLNADGSYTSAKGGGMLQGGGFMSNAMGAAGGALGLYSAAEGNGGFGGAGSGAMSGMELGLAIGGPVGAAVGAAAGAIIGAFGFGGREKAHVYDLKTVRPRIQTDQLAYNAGSMDYMAAYSDMQALDMEAKKATDSMGPAAKSYYHHTIEQEIHRAAQRFTREEKAGRSQYTATAASYDIGSDFVPVTGWNLNHRGERIIPSDENRQITRALNMHASYQAAMQRGGIPAMMRSGGDLHLHMNAIDAKSGSEFVMSQMHTVRRALNASYAENSGGADA